MNIARQAEVLVFPYFPVKKFPGNGKEKKAGNPENSRDFPGYPA
jgi:hypothetical protein